MDKERKLKISLLIEKLKRITGKKVELQESNDYLVSPSQILGILKDNLQDRQYLQMDLVNLEKVILKTMADGYKITQQSIPMFIDTYFSHAWNMN